MGDPLPRHSKYIDRPVPMFTRSAKVAELDLGDSAAALAVTMQAMATTVTTSMLTSGGCDEQALKG